jgi:cytochrome c-type biogenesis protein CcmH/NrfG
MGLAQTPAAPAILAAPSAAPTDPLISIANSVKTSAGKYTEFQSLCRENEFDRVADLTPEEQSKRIEFLQNKIKNTLVTAQLKIRLLKEYVDQKKYTEAEQFYSKLKEEKLTEEDRKTANALFLILKNDLKKAESILSKVVIENSKNIEALIYLAEIYKIDHNYFEAAAAYFDLVKMTKKSYDLELCEVHTLDSQHNEADKFCKKAIQFNQNNPFPYIYLGISRREKLNYDDASSYFKDSIKISKSEMGFSCLAEIYFINENYSLATDFFNRALQTNPRSSRAQLGLAWSQFKDKKIDNSLETFKLACSKDKRIKAEIRRAFKILTDEKSNDSKKFADLAQTCND